MKTLRLAAAAGMMMAIGLATGCGSTPNPGTREERAQTRMQSQAVIDDFKKKDPSMDRFFTTAEGYAIFPEVTSGALVVGGAHGNGEVFQRGRFIGYADVSQASIGAQVGGQKFAQIIFFQNEESLANFKAGTLEFDARATAIAASKGAAATADYSKGVAVFTLPQGGLMAQAAIGGQKFRFTPATASER
ncbi:MAG: hypothetical protein FWD61_16155 [Phycisphaerales bacterium]|nr:hypothetical protein [Phycisphaerales bacterium]